MLRAPSSVQFDSHFTRPRYASHRTHTIGAFIFDVDGVLTDTARFHLAAWKRLAEEERLPFADSLESDLRGRSREDSLRLVLGDRVTTAAKFAEMLVRKNQYYLDRVEAMTPADVLPRVPRLLSDLIEQNIRIAATSASRNARTVLERTGLLAFFESLFDGNHVPAGHAVRFDAAAESMEVLPDRCVVVEDSQAGITAARAMGMGTVGLGEPTVVGMADFVFPSISSIDTKTLLRSLSRKMHGIRPLAVRDLV